MFTFRLASAIVGLLLMSACGSSPTGKPLAAPSSNPTSAASPAPAANVVLVGGSVLMRLDGSVIATLPGAGVTDEHAVGAYLMVASDGSGKGWTIDASGAVVDVAPAAVAILSPSISGWSPPLIVDSSTAVIVRGAGDGLTANAVNLRTGAVRPLLTVPYTGVMALQALTVLDVSSDRKTVWLSKITPTGGISGRLEIIGIDLLTGTVSSQGQANALAGAEIAITRDGTSVAGQEEAGTNSSNLAIRHLHIVSLATGMDFDVQGAAPYVGGPTPPPSVLFSTDGTSVAWWGGLDNGDRSFVVNVASQGGSGRTLYNPAQIDFSFPISAVFWVDFNTLVVQHGSATYTINATTGAQRLVSQNLGVLAAVLS